MTLQSSSPSPCTMNVFLKQTLITFKTRNDCHLSRKSSRNDGALGALVKHSDVPSFYYLQGERKNTSAAQHSTAPLLSRHSSAPCLHVERKSTPTFLLFLIYSPLNSFQHPLHYSFFLPFLGFFTTFYLTLLSRCCRCGRTYSTAQHSTGLTSPMSVAFQRQLRTAFAVVGLG